MDVRAGQLKRLRAKELMPASQLNCDAEAEAPILWPPNANSQLIRKDSDAGKGCRQKEKKVAEDEIVR